MADACLELEGSIFLIQNMRVHARPRGGRRAYLRNLLKMRKYLRWLKSECKSLARCVEELSILPEAERHLRVMKAEPFVSPGFEMSRWMADYFRSINTFCAQFTFFNILNLVALVPLQRRVYKYIDDSLLILDYYLHSGKLLNATTRSVMRDTDLGLNLIQVKNGDDLFKNLNA